jgi:hypothetical protein
MADTAATGTTAPAGTTEHKDPLTEAATALALPFTLTRQLLPDNPVPVALGVGALAVAGVIEWPVAAALGLGYLALRRWHRP